MVITKLIITDFGKFHGKEIELGNGFTVIYGDNEAGKTTIRDFIVAMIYGIDRMRGIASRTDEYTVRQPFHNRGFSGSMEFTIDGLPYVLERNFSKNEKATRLYRRDSGREIPLDKEHSLVGTLIQMEKKPYLNTRCIGQEGAGYPKELASYLNHYLVNMAATKSADVDCTKTLAYLTREKKRMSTKEIDEELEGLSVKLMEEGADGSLQELATQRAKLEVAIEEQVRKKEQQKRFEQEQAMRKRELQRQKQKEEQEKQLKQDLQKDRQRVTKMLLLGVIVLINIVIFGLIYFLKFDNNQKVLLAVCVGLLEAWTLLTALLRSRKKQEAMLDDEAEENPEPDQTGKAEDSLAEQSEATDIEGEKQLTLQYAERLATIRAREEELLHKAAAKEQAQKRYQELQRERAERVLNIQALELAIATIRSVSEGIFDDFGGKLNERVSAIASQLTEGKYTEIKVEEDLNVKIRYKGCFIGPEHISNATAQQLYMAVRLAVAELLGEKELPVLLDDSFGAYDDKRLAAVLRYLVNADNKQCLCFTSDSRILRQISEYENVTCIQL